MLEVVENNKPMKYDAILIDEGQDFCLEWYETMCKFLTTRDELVIVCDKKQNIYDRESEWLDKRRDKKLGKLEKSKEDWIELKTMYRLPREIAELSTRFSNEYCLNHDVEPERFIRKSFRSGGLFP